MPRGGLLGRKVQLIAYDDQTNPATTPGIYTKLLDVDKVDLLIAPYGTNPTAPIMPLVKQRDLLLMGNFSFDVNAQIKHDKWFNNAPWGAGAVAWGGTFLEAGKKLGAKTIAFMAADAEFAQNLCTGGRAIAKAIGLQNVYDQNYPPNTVDFSLDAARGPEREARRRVHLLVPGRVGGDRAGGRTRSASGRRLS